MSEFAGALKRKQFKSNTSSHIASSSCIAWRIYWNPCLELGHHTITNAKEPISESRAEVTHNAPSKAPTKVYRLPTTGHCTNDA